MSAPKRGIKVHSSRWRPFLFSTDFSAGFSAGLGFAGCRFVNLAEVSLMAFNTMGSIRLSGSPRASHSWAVTSTWSSRIPIGIATSKVEWVSSSVVVVSPFGVFAVTRTSGWVWLDGRFTFMVLLLDGLDDLVQVLSQHVELRERTSGDAGPCVGFQQPKMATHGRARASPEPRPLPLRELLGRHDLGRRGRRLLRLAAAGARFIRSRDVRSRPRATLVHRVVANRHACLRKSE